MIKVGVLGQCTIASIITGGDDTVHPAIDRFPGLERDNTLWDITVKDTDTGVWTAFFCQALLFSPPVGWDKSPSS